MQNLFFSLFKKSKNKKTFHINTVHYPIAYYMEVINN